MKEKYRNINTLIIYHISYQLDLSPDSLGREGDGKYAIGLIRVIMLEGTGRGDARAR